MRHRSTLPVSRLTTWIVDPAPGRDRDVVHGRALHARAAERRAGHGAAGEQQRRDEEGVHTASTSAGRSRVPANCALGRGTDRGGATLFTPCEQTRCTPAAAGYCPPFASVRITPSETAPTRTTTSGRPRTRAGRSPSTACRATHRRRSPGPRPPGSPPARLGGRRASGPPDTFADDCMTGRPTGARNGTRRPSVVGSGPHASGNRPAGFGSSSVTPPGSSRSINARVRGPDLRPVHVEEHHRRRLRPAAAP